VTPGALDQRVRLETQSLAADGYGGAALTWSLLAEVWALARPLSGRERAEAATIEAPAMYRFTIRRRADLTEGMRVVWNGQAFNVRFIADGGPRDLYMTLDAERGVAI
jgi:SPP1 family predicted phage head-tail adaptor